jgi:hypothetical protein
MDLDLDANIVQELRTLASRGTPPSELVSILGRRLGLENTNFRLLAIAYFREAFFLTLADAKQIGAASIFPDGERDDSELDREIESIMRGTMERWKG